MGSLKLGTIAAILLLAGSAFAGEANGKTKIDFRATIGDSGSSSRIFAKRDVAAGVAQLPEVGSSSKNDNLAGAAIKVTIGSAEFPATADVKGKVVDPYALKLTANGRILQLKADGLNLEQLLQLSTVDGSYTTSVLIKITATPVDGTEVVLTEETVTFYYKVKNGEVKGTSKAPKSR